MESLLYNYTQSGPALPRAMQMQTRVGLLSTQAPRSSPQDLTLFCDCAVARVDSMAEPEPEPEPEPGSSPPQIRIEQFTEEVQGVQVHGLCAVLTGARSATRARDFVLHGRINPALAARQLCGQRSQVCASCGSAMTQRQCLTRKFRPRTNLCARPRSGS